MPRIYCFKNCAETVNEEFREKSEIVSLDFAVLRYTLRLRIDVFYSLTVVFLFSQFFKGIPIDFPRIYEASSGNCDTISKLQ